MKKLVSISNQIKNNTFSYTGKGAFEAVVTNFKNDITTWLEDLVPLQRQIEYLEDMANIQFQKRNYTRVLTKLLPQEYKEFVNVNILVRDSSIIAKYYHNEFNLTLLYDKLISDKYLKYPGQHEKYVDFEIFQKFIMTYRDDLTNSLEKQSSSQSFKKEEEPNIKVNTTKEEVSPKKTDPKQETNWTSLLLGR